MANRPSRPAPVLLSVLLVGVSACSAHATEEPDVTVKKGISAIVVGPRPCDLNYPKVQISKADDEISIWVAKKKTDILRIEFDQEVFEGMWKNGARWVPGGCGASRVCLSGNVKATVAPSPTVEYKYWQFLRDSAGNDEGCDGRMIINP